VDLLFLIWLIMALVGTPDSCSGESVLAKDACDTLSTVGAAIGAALSVSLSGFVSMILGVLPARDKSRRSPLRCSRISC